MAKSGALFEIDFKPNLSVVQAHYRELGIQIKSFKEPLRRAVKQVIIPSIRTNFDVGGRPAWAPYADSTLDFHDMLNEAMSQSMLVKSGALRQTMGYLNIWTFTKEEAFIDGLPSNVWYGKLHQQGFNKIPARPFIMLQSKDEQDIERIFEKWLEERIEKAWPGGT